MFAFADRTPDSLSGVDPSCSAGSIGIGKGNSVHGTWQIHVYLKYRV